VLPGFSDKIAISLSILCVIHCLVVPLLIAFLPSMILLQQEAFHLWMVILVVPISIYALTLGCKKHKKLSIVTLGMVGLICLLSAVFFGESHIGETGEKLITIIGALLVSISHYQNFNQCKKSHDGQCPS
jgi:hypothetical protein